VDNDCDVRERDDTEKRIGVRPHRYRATSGRSRDELTRWAYIMAAASGGKNKKKKKKKENWPLSVLF